MRWIGTLALGFLLVGAGLPGEGVASTWVIDSAHSNAQFAVRHLVVSKVRGHLGTVTGTMTLDEKNLAASSVVAEVDVTGVSTANAKRDDHLRAEDYLDTAKYPTLSFRSKSVSADGENRFRVVGDLTLRGVTREVELEVEGSPKPIVDPWGKTRLGGVVRAEIKRDDFGIGGQKLMDGGGLVMGNEVEITIDVELTKTAD